LTAEIRGERAGAFQPAADLVHATGRVERSACVAAMPFESLTAVPAGDTLYAVVHYVQASAPKGFADRATLS
jgi:hypothetical protein